MITSTGSLTRNTTARTLRVEPPHFKTMIVTVDASQVASGGYISFYIQGVNTLSTPFVTFGGTIKSRDIVVPEEWRSAKALEIVHYGDAIAADKYVIEVT